jgi:hypothetical protein
MGADIGQFGFFVRYVRDAASTMKGEISYDLVMVEEMAFVEGTFRVADGDWQVLIFAHDPVEQPEVTLGQWASGVKGIFVRLPLSTRLNRQVVEKLMSDQFGVEQWNEVCGPDSMQLR